MRKFIFALAFIVLLLGCTQPPEKVARDIIAANNGLLLTAMVQHHDECVADTSKSACQLILKDIAAQNLAIQSLEAYCSFGPSSRPTDECVPVKSLSGALVSALKNLNSLSGQLKAAVQ